MFMDKSINRHDELCSRRAPRISEARIAAAKRSFVTRLVNPVHIARIDPDAVPKAGDLCLARLVRKGHHQRLELTNGRRARMHAGDELILSYGNRYATDQFHARVPDQAGPCQLVAAGGIAAQSLDRHTSTRRPTDIEVLGTLCREDGRAVNLADYALERGGNDVKSRQSFVIAVFGSGMNAGKTTSVCNIVKSLKRANLTCAAVKLTGTGAGGDMWQYQDAGAARALDFVDAGYASTMGLEGQELDHITRLLLDEVDGSVDCIVAEVADGLLQRETQMILQSSIFRERMGSLVLAVGDPLAALGGQAFLDQLGYRVSAFTGLIGASPLFVEELRAASPTPVLTRRDLKDGDRSPLTLLQRANLASPMHGPIQGLRVA